MFHPSAPTTSRLPGARELGLAVEWRIRFVPHGSHAETTPGAVYVDVGGRAAPGIVDHHEGDGDRCASAVALHHRELVYNHLLGPWLARVEEGRVQPGTRWAPTIITHEQPDWDSLVAVFLVQRLVDDGDFPAFAWALVSYASDVDQGRHALVADAPTAFLAPHLGYLAIQHLKDVEGQPLSSDAQLARGLRLLQAVVDDVAPQGRAWPSDFLPTNGAARRWSERAEFEDVRRFLADERERFERDRQMCHTDDSVLLPAADGGRPIPVKVLVLDRPPESALNKYWVRAAGFPYFICPYSTTIRKNPGRVPFPRVVLSLDPNWNDHGRAPNLRGLGFALERAESRARRSARGGVDDRGGAARFSDGYCDNSDPWYDGRAHDWTIADSPACGTELAYKEVVDMATGGTFWQVPLRSATVTLAFLDTESSLDDIGPHSAPVPFVDASVALSPFFADTREDAGPADALCGKSTGPFAVRFHQRHFPEDTAPGFRLVTVSTGDGATLEALVELRRELAARAEPVFTFARIRLGSHVANPRLVDRLLEGLAGGVLDPVESARASARTSCSGHALVCDEADEDARPENAADPLREVAMYVAFLREALSDYSRRIAEAVPPAGRPIDEVKTEALRRSFLRLQARYYTLEVSRRPELQAVFNRLAETSSLGVRYEEVQQQLEQLGRLEQQVHERRKSRADRVIQATLYFLSVAGFARVVLALLTWQGSTRSLWLSLAPILVVAILIYVLFVAMSRRR